MVAKFILAEQADTFKSVVDRMDLPEGLTLRPISFETDMTRISDMILDFGKDSIDPAYGMSPETDPDTLCLVAERDGRLLGQISCSLDVLGQSQTNIDLWVTGVFVSSHARGQGLSKLLGNAALGMVEAWRRQVAADLGRNPYGSISVSADTEPDTAGDILIEKMQDKCLELEDLAFEGPDPEGPGEL